MFTEVFTVSVCDTVGFAQGAVAGRQHRTARQRIVVLKLALLAPLAIDTLVTLVVSPVSRKLPPVDVVVRLDRVCVLVAVAALLLHVVELHG